MPLSDPGNGLSRFEALRNEALLLVVAVGSATASRRLVRVNASTRSFMRWHRVHLDPLMDTIGSARPETATRSRPECEGGHDQTRTGKLRE
jgi:hypothetical protein